MKVGDYVEWEIEEGDAWALGEIIELLPAALVKVIEAHAMHRIWGGSSAQRGRVVELSLSEVKHVRTGWKHIVRDGLATYRRNPAKWDKAREELNAELEAHGG